MKFSIPTILIASLVSLVITAPTNKDSVVGNPFAIINNIYWPVVQAVRLRGEGIADIEARAPANKDTVVSGFSSRWMGRNC